MQSLRRSPPPFVLALFACTIFLGAFLVFLIQPVFAKLILPWFGGSAAVWTTCLAFFQTALLLGYFYAHILARRFSPNAQVFLHIALLAAALLLLPVIPGARWKPPGGDDPTWRILAMLAVVLGLPYLLLSATSPLLQSWWARRWPGSPYRFFALSNAASLLALCAYPVLIEPSLATRTQAVLWSAAFAAFAALCTTAAWLSRTRDSVMEPAPRAPAPARLAAWIALSAAGSMLLVSTTSQLTQNVASVPFLWIVPLALYLLTFILCFESARWYRRGVFLRLLAFALGILGYTVSDVRANQALVVAFPVFTIGLFVCCMFCHGELSRLKPDPRRLTSFYLMVALGGGLGSILVVLVAPRIFVRAYELPLSLVLVAALALWRTWSGGWPHRLAWSAVTAGMALVVASQVQGSHANALALTRSFYGALRVVETRDAGARVLTLYHGGIKHGSQFESPERRGDPTAYYGPDSGAGLAIRFCREGAKRIGVIGLGTGTLACYGQAGDLFRFYEIDPQVIDLARSMFTYLRDARAQIDLVAGDGRLSLEREPPQRFDVLAVDAFSGDAIPVHLLTREAFAVYLRHLAPGGILALHLSNDYLDLPPVARRLADSLGYTAVEVRSRREPERMISAADWVLLTRNDAFLATPKVAQACRPISPRPGLRLWTDDYNNLLQVIKLTPSAETSDQR